MTRAWARAYSCRLGHGSCPSRHRRAPSSWRAFDALGYGHHERLAVVVEYRRELESEDYLAGQGPGGVAHQQVDLAFFQRRKACGGHERHECDLVRVPQHGRGHGTAEVDVEAQPGPAAFRSEKPGMPSLTPQRSCPRAWMVGSRSAP